MQRPFFSQVQLPTLSERHLTSLRDKWNERLQDPLAFVPKKQRDLGVSPEEARRENEKFGEFASGYLKQILRQGDLKLRLQRLREEKKIVAVGYGNSYDSHWLEDAVYARLQTLWIDVSSYACQKALKDMRAQAELIPELERFTTLQPIVKEAEIRSALNEPWNIDLYPDSVEMWYLSRTLGCLPLRSARNVLQMIGRSLGEETDPEKVNSIIIINALRDYNPHVIGDTTNLYSKRMIISNIQRGAYRPVRVCNEASYHYWEKVVTAMIVRAR